MLIIGYSLFESLSKAKKIVFSNLPYSQEREGKFSIFYDKLNKIQLAKPIYLSWLILFKEENPNLNNKIEDVIFKYLPLYDKFVEKKLKDVEKIYDKNNKKFNYLNYEDFVNFIRNQVGEEVIEDLNVITDRQYLNTNEAIVVLDSARWYVVKITSQQAMNFYGSDSRWCTVSGEGGLCNSYLLDGDLYVIIDKTKMGTSTASKKYLLYITPDNTEITNLKDDPDFSILEDSELNNLFSPLFNIPRNIIANHVIRRESDTYSLIRIKSIFNSLKYFKNIKTLNLSYNKIPLRKFNNIIKLTDSIEKFIIFNAFKNDKNILNLEAKNVNHLLLNDNNLIDLNIKYKKELKFLNLNNNNLINFTGDYPNLEELYLSSNKLKLFNVNAPKLKVLKLDTNYTLESINLELKNLHTLDITDAFAEKLTPSLKKELYEGIKWLKDRGNISKITNNLDIYKDNDLNKIMKL